MLAKESSFLDMGFILADARVTFLSPVLFGMDVRVQAAITRLGNKSITMEYLMVDNEASTELARGSTVMVTFDYHTNSTTPIPEPWRGKIKAFEGISD